MYNYFSKEDTQMDIYFCKENKQKRCLISLTIREMQLKTMRYHFTPFDMAIVTHTTHRKLQVLIGCGRMVPLYNDGGNARWWRHNGKG